MNGNWIFWVVIFWWVIPMVMRKMRQSGPGTGRPPYPRDRENQYGQDRYSQGQYNQGQYNQGQYPGYPQTQTPPPPPSPQGQHPEGQLPEGQRTAAPGQPDVPWWQQPLPPGFPGQPAPQSQPRPQAQPAPQAGPAQQSRAVPQAPRIPEPAETSAPDDAPQGYRAKKLAELDRQFSDQKISLEEYMKARSEVMRG
jgi:hypothetical protein